MERHSIRIKLLSNPLGNLGGLQCIPAPTADAAGLTAVFGEPAFAELAKSIPCLLAAADAERLPPEAVCAFQAAGGRVAGIGEIADTAPPFAQTPGALTAFHAGDWYLQAPAKAGTSQGSTQSVALRLLQLVTADADLNEIEAVLRHDPAMSYQLLRLVNSVGVGAGRRIANFSQAILLLGRRQLKRWLNLMLFSPKKEDPRSAMLLARVSVRARTLELLATALGYDKETQERAFMAGMLSMLGVLFGLPLPDVLAPLELEETLEAALLRGAGELGALLAFVAAEEHGGAAAAGECAGRMGSIDIDAVEVAANLWMLALNRELGGGHA